MKDEIKEILEIRSVEQQAIDNLKTIISCKDKIIEIEPPLEDTAQILLDYITNLQEENERLKEELVSKPDIEWELETKDGQKFSIIQSKRIDMQEELNKSIVNLQSRIEKAIDNIDITIELIKQQPTEDDTWILDRLNGFKYLLQGVGKDD